VQAIACFARQFAGAGMNMAAPLARWKIGRTTAGKLAGLQWNEAWKGVGTRKP